MKAALAAATLAIAAGNALGQSEKSPAKNAPRQGAVMVGTSPGNEITALTTKLIVPPSPPPIGTLFLWPGLQPGGANFLPIDNGVLQSVLTWGDSCAPGVKPTVYSSWWISAQYVNTFGHHAGYTGCQGGAVLRVSPGDVLLVRMSLYGTVWTQTVLALQKKQSVSYQIDLKGQAQTFARFTVEPAGVKPISDVVFLDTAIEFAKPDALNCLIRERGPADSVEPPVSMNGGQTCYIGDMTLPIDDAAPK